VSRQNPKRDRDIPAKYNKKFGFGALDAIKYCIVFAHKAIKSLIWKVVKTAQKVKQYE
jgi:hypothetical protein